MIEMLCMDLCRIADRDNRQCRLVSAARCEPSDVSIKFRFGFFGSLVNRAVTSIGRNSLSNVVYDYGKFTLGPVLTHI